jgi:hypothetical protein
MPAILRRAIDALLGAVTPGTEGRMQRRVAGWWPQAGEPIFDRREGFDLDTARRLGYWQGQESRRDFVHAWKEGERSDLERPWNFRWDRVPKHSAGPGFTEEQYDAARERSRDVARETLGEALWLQLERQGYLDLPSSVYDGVTYRLRVGRRIEVLCGPGVEAPWYFDFLCINPVYPLPEYEFFAQLYLYVRDQEEEVIRVAAPQPWDQALGRTF